MEVCLRREIKEETGIDLTSVGKSFYALDVIDKDDSGNIHFHYCVVDLVGFAYGHPIAGDDAADARWVSLETCTQELDVHEEMKTAVEELKDLVRRDALGWPHDS